MPNRYQDVYPSDPLLDSSRVARPSAAELLTLEYFEAAGAEMPARVFAQHHILLNLRDQPQPVETLRDGHRRRFVLRRDEVVVTPAGVRAGWRWSGRSKVIIVTLDPARFERFAQTELGLLLNPDQLRSVPQGADPDLCRAGHQLLEALVQRQLGYDLVFESLARVFLVQLIQRYGDRRQLAEAGRGFTPHQYRRVLDYVAEHFARPIAVEEMARAASLSPSHFSRSFKATVGQSPHRFVMAYRVERARRLLARRDLPLASVALRCGFADQAHFSRTFKQHAGVTPKAYRASF